MAYIWFQIQKVLSENMQPFVCIQCLKSAESAEYF